MVSPLPGEGDWLPMDALETVLQHGSVVLIEYVWSNLNDARRRDTDHVAVKCGVVQLAKRETIGYDGRPADVYVRNDVCVSQSLGDGDAER
jgi:hypothetical protein